MSRFVASKGFEKHQDITSWIIHSSPGSHRIFLRNHILQVKEHHLPIWQCRITLQIYHCGHIYLPKTELGLFSIAPEYWKNLFKRSADLGSDVEDRPRLSPQKDLVLIVDGLVGGRQTHLSLPLRQKYFFTPLCYSHHPRYGHWALGTWSCIHSGGLVWQTKLFPLVPEVLQPIESEYKSQYNKYS